MPVSVNYKPEKAILELGEGFFDPVEPAIFPKQTLRFQNAKWAARVGLDSLKESEWLAHFACFHPLPGGLEKPLALRYHGHQFGTYNPQLGDGRGFLFAQLRDDQNRLLDLGTKGSGQTPYSRAGDGRLTLKGAVREALATEMLESLGVNTSKTFCFFETGESLERHDEPSPTRAGVLTRLNHSHVRYGTFQRLAYHNETEKIRALIDYCGRHFFPEILEASVELRAGAFFRLVTERAAKLCASWMINGFVHGVLNTDNMNITGESFDYGPYRFLPHYDPQFTAAYFDHSGFYAYGRQPDAVLWSLDHLGRCLKQVSEVEPLQAAIEIYGETFNQAATEIFLARLGVDSRGADLDARLMMAGFEFLNESRTPFEEFFFFNYGARNQSTDASPKLSEFLSILKTYSVSREAQKRLSDPYFQRVRPCTLLIDEIEWIWDAIATDDNWTRFNQKIDEIRNMGRVFGHR